MQTKLKPYTTKALYYVGRMSDIRFAGQVLFAVIVLLMTWSGIKTVQTNYGLQKQISAIKQQTAVKSLENNNLKLQNDYYQSNQYLELAARQNFGLAASGEKEILVSEDVALAHTVDLPKQKTTSTTKLQPAYESNFQSWVDFFLHRKGQ